VNAYLYEQTCGFMRKPDIIARCACLCQVFTPPDLKTLGIPLSSSRRTTTRWLIWSCGNA